MSQNILNARFYEYGLKCICYCKTCDNSIIHPQTAERWAVYCI